MKTKKLLTTIVTVVVLLTLCIVIYANNEINSVENESLETSFFHQLHDSIENIRDFTGLSESQIEQIKELRGDYAGAYLRQEMLIRGEITPDAPRLTFTQAETFTARLGAFTHDDCPNCAVQACFCTRRNEELRANSINVASDILNAFLRIQKYPDYVALGPDSTNYVFWLDEKGDNTIEANYIHGRSFSVIAFSYNHSSNGSVGQGRELFPIRWGYVEPFVEKPTTEERLREVLYRQTNKIQQNGSRQASDLPRLDMETVKAIILKHETCADLHDASTDKYDLFFGVIDEFNKHHGYPDFAGKNSPSCPYLSAVTVLEYWLDEKGDTRIIVILEHGDVLVMFAGDPNLYSLFSMWSVDFGAFKGLTSEQIAQLVELWGGGAPPTGGRRVWQEAVIRGEISADSPRLTMTALNLILSRDSSGRAVNTNHFRSVMSAIEQIQKFPDFVGGSGITRSEYWLDEDGDEVIAVFRDGQSGGSIHHFVRSQERDTVLVYDYSIHDSLNILKDLAKLKPLSELQLVKYDFNDSGNITINNALEILKYLARLPSLVGYSQTT
jgi:hypothetical protein